MIRTAVITVSDSRTAATDVSGNRLVELIESTGGDVFIRRSVTDDLLSLSELLRTLSDQGEVDLIVTTGGTGLGPRDNTPEATRAVIEREAAGIAEAMRRETAVHTPMAMLSRGVCGIRSNTLIINFPGSPKAVEQCFEVIRPVLGHAVRLISGDTRHDA